MLYTIALTTIFNNTVGIYRYVYKKVIGRYIAYTHLNVEFLLRSNNIQFYEKKSLRGRGNGDGTHILRTLDGILTIDVPILKKQ